LENKKEEIVDGLIAAILFVGMAFCIGWFIDAEKENDNGVIIILFLGSGVMALIFSLLYMIVRLSGNKRTK